MNFVDNSMFNTHIDIYNNVSLKIMLLLYTGFFVILFYTYYIYIKFVFICNFVNQLYQKNSKIIFTIYFTFIFCILILNINKDVYLLLYVCPIYM